MRISEGAGGSAADDVDDDGGGGSSEARDRGLLDDELLVRAEPVRDSLRPPPRLDDVSCDRLDDCFLRRTLRCVGFGPAAAAAGDEKTDEGPDVLLAAGIMDRTEPADDGVPEPPDPQDWFWCARPGLGRAEDLLVAVEADLAWPPIWYASLAATSDSYCCCWALLLNTGCGRKLSPEVSTCGLITPVPDVGALLDPDADLVSPGGPLLASADGSLLTDAMVTLSCAKEKALMPQP